jgi:hypothetical protein
VRINETGGEDTAGGVEKLRARESGKKFFGGASGFDGGDPARFEPDFAFGMDALGVRGEQAGAGEDEIRGFAAHRDGGEGTGEGMEWGDGETGEGHAQQEHPRCQLGEVKVAALLTNKKRDSFIA